MKALTYGFWGTSHWILDLIGRGTVRCIPAQTSVGDDEVYSMTGGAIVGAIFGAGLGFLLSALSPSLNVDAGMAIGSLIGVSTGIGCGAIVQIVDEYIDTVLNGISSK